MKASFNPIAAFYNDPVQAWIYANSEAAETRDALGPDSWDRYNELRKYSSTSLQPVDPEKAFKKWGASLSGVADRLVALEEFWAGGAGQLNPPRRSRINPA